MTENAVEIVAAKRKKTPKKMQGTAWKDGAWWARIYHDGKEIWRRCDTQAQAATIYGALRKQRREDRLFDKKLKHTLEEVIPLYWRVFATRGRVDRVRAEGIMKNHLLPFFGGRSLRSLKAEDGLGYVTHRQQQKATAGTIRREWQVLTRLLNLAVSYDKLDKNRLKTVDLPEAAKRTRVAEVDELERIRTVKGEAVKELWRMVIAAASTGLREGKLLSISRTWIRKESDGYWLVLPPALTKLKGNPAEIPLNTSAVKALMDDDLPSLSDDRMFRRWDHARAFKKYWDRACTGAKIVDLHFHDLRHTFATRLQRLGVDYEVRQALLGHKMGGTTADYSHGGPEWRAKLRAAVQRLDEAYPMGHFKSGGKSGGDVSESRAVEVQAVD
jgi:integrase